MVRIKTGKEKVMKPQDNQSNTQNPNKGTDGTNKQYDQNQGNRGKQMNPKAARGEEVKGAKNKYSERGRINSSCPFFI